MKQTYENQEIKFMKFSSLEKQYEVKLHNFDKRNGYLSLNLNL